MGVSKHDLHEENTSAASPMARESTIPSTRTQTITFFNVSLRMAATLRVPHLCLVRRAQLPCDHVVRDTRCPDVLQRCADR